MKRFKVLFIWPIIWVAFCIMPCLAWAGPMNIMPNVKDEMLNASYWVNKLKNPEKILMTNNEIEAFNQEIINKMPDIVYNLNAYPNKLSKDQLNKLLGTYSFPKDTMYVNGNVVDRGYYDNLKKLMNYEGIQNENAVQYGFTVKRANLRTFPTADAVLEEPNDIEFDMFQETAIEPAQPLLVLHTSNDGQWFFIQTFNYIGWMKADCIAVGSKEEWLTYQKNNKFLVVTGSEVRLGFNEYSPEISELSCGMGVRLPLAADVEIPQLVDNQSVAGNYVIKVPTRDTDGKLKVKLALISAANDVSEGYLPYTRANIIKQAFKMQGQRYGWGGSFNSRDCSAFIKDIFAVFGFALPRNADEQERSVGITVTINDNATIAKRNELLNNSTPGAALYTQGHTMLYLGEDNQHHYILHDAAAQGDPNQKLPDGKLKRVPINQVILTDVTMYKASGKQLLEAIRTIKLFEK